MDCIMINRMLEAVLRRGKALRSGRETEGNEKAAPEPQRKLVIKGVMKK